jgi:catechol 2,3-dioxygenase-like lactoylglutathione lyase family enzyme
MKLRSVELQLADVAGVAEFFERVWGLAAAESSGGTRYLRGTAGHPYIVSLTAADTPALTGITFSATPEELERTRARVRRSGAPCHEIEDSGFSVKGPEGQIYRFVKEAEVAALQPHADKPIELSHVVLNALDVEACERFALEALGFTVSDRTAHMRFLRCNRKHHALAYASGGLSSLNHVAFDMRDLEAVMRGIGRLRDAGYPCTWGPGRHGPGNNVFGYFIGLHGGIIEYTSEVSQVGDDYKVGSPQDWKWPPGRTDHWGVSSRDSARMAAAERAFRWAGA